MKYCGTVKSNGEPCKHQAGFGTDHLGFGKCRFHGGTSPALRIAAAREEAEETVHRLRMGQLSEADPGDVLVEEVWRSHGMVRFLDQLIGELEGPDILYYTEQGFKPRAYLDVYERERMHMAKVSKMALEAGVDERRVRIQERQGVLVGQALVRILQELGLNPEQRAKAPAIVRKHLMAIGQAEETP